MNDETRNNFPDKVSNLSVAKTHFDRQPHTHHMVAGQRVETSKIPEFFTVRILTLHIPPSHQLQNPSTQVSQDNNLPMVETTPRNQNSDANNFIIRLAETIAGIETQQQPQSATMLKSVSTNTFVFDRKNEKLEHFGDLFHMLLKTQPEMPKR